MSKMKRSTGRTDLYVSLASMVKGYISFQSGVDLLCFINGKKKQTFQNL